MSELKNFIEKYWAGELTPAEKELLIKMLEEKIADHANHDDYNAFLQIVNEKGTLQNKRDLELTRIFEQIKEKLKIEEEPLNVYSINSRKRWGWVAAAAVLFAVVSVWWLFKPRTQNKNIALQTAPVWITVKNGKASIKDTMLSDGSIVKMYPNTQISFADGFSQNIREIKMSGNALFKVAKDTTRPFIVYAGGFSTRALGTEFEVNTLIKETFLVKLLEGKVVVKATENKINPMAAVYLSPGQKFSYDLVNKKATVGKIVNEQTVANKDERKVTEKNETVNPPQLVYTKLPLSVIFQQLQTEYSIIIIYDENAIKDKEYSGSFLKTDNPGKILKTIAKQFGWKVHIENGAYRIE